VNNAFAGCSNLTLNATDAPNLSGVTDMDEMFRGASAFNGNISGWNTASVEDMSGMFRGASAFNGNISGWNTANVTNLGSMFNGASAFNQDLSTWNTANVTNMSSMFNSASAFNQNIGAWNTAKVTNMSLMFRNATLFNGDISNWNTTNVTNMSFMFTGAKAFNGNISGWNTANVTNMLAMFYGAKAFNQDINTWNTANVTNMSLMFREASAFNQNIGAWNTANVTDMSSMFNRASAFNGNISGWNSAKVTNMTFMFNGASAFNQNIGAWNTANVTDMSSMFANAGAFNQSISTWNTAKVTNMSSMFNSAISFNQNLGSWNVTALTNAANMFTNATLSISNYDALLIGWNAQTLKPNVTFGGGGSNKYCNGAAARANMLSSDNWTITDGGLDCSTPISQTINYTSNGASNPLGPTLIIFQVINGAPLEITVDFTPQAGTVPAPPPNALPLQWDASASHSSFSVIVTQCYDPSILTGQAENTLHVFHYNGTSWDDLGGTLDTTTHAPYHCITATVELTALSPLALAPSSNTALNVTNLRASINKQGHVIIKWRTTSEAQIEGFNVYRKLGTGKWRLLTKQIRLAKHPTNAPGARYRFKDMTARKNETYRYRIEVIYLDGHSEFTKPIKFTVKESFNLFPMPRRQDALILFPLKQWMSTLFLMN